MIDFVARYRSRAAIEVKYHDRLIENLLLIIRSLRNAVHAAAVRPDDICDFQFVAQR